MLLQNGNLSLELVIGWMSVKILWPHAITPVPGEPRWKMPDWAQEIIHNYPHLVVVVGLRFLGVDPLDLSGERLRLVSQRAGSSSSLASSRFSA